jgi:hypothetical protein
VKIYCHRLDSSPASSLTKRRGDNVAFSGKAIPLEKVPLFLREGFRESSLFFNEYLHSLEKTEISIE